MSESLRIIFAGTPEFSVPPLKALLTSPHRVVAAYTQPDRPAGRGRKLTPSPVKEAAMAAGVPVYQPTDFRHEADLGQLEALHADLMVVVAYGLLLPPRVLAAPRLGCVNIHASILPRWRGAAPIQRALLAGDTETGVTIMQMEKGLDTGPVYLVRRLPIAPEDTGGSLHDKLSVLGAEALMAALPGIADGSALPEPQDPGRASYARKLDKAEARVDWTRPAQEIARQVRAFNPWPVAHTLYEDANLRLWAAEAVPGLGGSPGMVMAAGRAGIDIATGEGLLRVTRLQMPGKRVMKAAEFVNAHAIQGVQLG
ncbi:MAG: methionyl-tRNA formyltransferase [Pseudomonadota bacterium]